jgi:replicative DNA helicase
MDDDNINPYNLEAEQQILGAILIENNLIRKTNISIEDFYAQKHKQIYEAMIKLDIDGLPIDIISLKEKGIEDISYISSLASNMATTANISYHADLVKEDSKRRKLRTICLKTLNDINEESIDTLLSNLRNGVSALVKGRGSKIVSSREIALELSEFIERRARNKNILSGISSGFKDLDDLTDGFQNGEQIIIAARPGVGKSAIALACAENAGIPVGVISIEMGGHQLGIRTLATLSGIELWRLRKGILSDMHWSQITDGLVRLSELPIYFSFSSKTTIEIERTITQMIESYTCKMIIVDYLQLTKGAESKKREQEIAEVSRTLKLAAVANNIPIIALSQLNREVEKRENKRPMLSDLRESGAIEQDADVVIFLYREKQDSTVIELNIAKGRNCGLGTLKLYFNSDTMTFRSYQDV